MTVRLLLDEMYPPKLADTLRDKGHDVRRWPRTRVGLHRLADALHDAISGDRIPDRDDVRCLA